jgi:hypothetical protein
MTTEEYMNKKFQSEDIVKVYFYDGTERLIVLDRPGLYTRPSQTVYPTYEIIPGGEPEIVVYQSLDRPTRPEGEGIPISQVRDVIVVERPD